MSMTSRERVIKAINHEEPDRVPLDLGSTRNSSILIPPYEALTDYLGLSDEETDAPNHGISKLLGMATPSESVLQRLNIDFRGIYLGKADNSIETVLPDGTHRDEIGVIRRQPVGMPYWDVISSPFSGTVSLSDIQKWNRPDPTDPGYTRGIRQKALALRDENQYATVLHLQDIIIHPCQFLLGFEKWYMSFIAEPQLISSLMDIMLELRIELTKRALKEVGDLIDVVSCSDDICDMRGPMLSPEMYDKFIKPRHTRYFDQIRSLTTAKVLYHSCGAVSKLIPAFIDMGIDFINPVQVSAQDMDTERLKKDFGNKIGFWGAVDTTHVLPFCNQEKVVEEVKKRIRDLAPGGGYVLCAVHNIQPNVPPENIVKMYDAAIEFGKYPIDLLNVRNSKTQI